MSKNPHKLIIIGSGPAGLTAGLYAARANLTPIILEGSMPGGQLIKTSYVENWPGERSILGPTLMEKMRAHAQDLGCTFIPETAINFEKNGHGYQVDTSRQQLTALSIIIATGATPKRLGIAGEDMYWGKGLTTCAVCDGAFYKDQAVVIVGGGDTAMEDASFMTKFTNNITIVHILDKLTASHAMQQRVINNPAIKIIYESTVTTIEGNGNHVTHVTITDQKTRKQSILPSQVIFLAIGLHPNTKIFEGKVAMNEHGYLTLTDQTKTSLPGVFGAGDVADAQYRQAITSAGAGCMAALDAQRYLASLL